jgi:hypothetical protein
MPRRVSLPGAAELFRATPAAPIKPAETASLDRPQAEAEEEPQSIDLTRSLVADSGQLPAAEAVEHEGSAKPSGSNRATTSAARGSGRVRHDEKITVYVSNEELLDLERARLSLRADHGMAVDRGRIVREALALVIGDLTERGPDSDLVRRLSQP